MSAKDFLSQSPEEVVKKFLPPPPKLAGNVQYLFQWGSHIQEGLDKLCSYYLIPRVNYISLEEMLKIVEPLKEIEPSIYNSMISMYRYKKGEPTLYGGGKYYATFYPTLPYDYIIVLAFPSDMSALLHEFWHHLIYCKVPHDIALWAAKTEPRPLIDAWVGGFFLASKPVFDNLASKGTELTLRMKEEKERELGRKLKFSEHIEVDEKAYEEIARSIL